MAPGLNGRQTGTVPKNKVKGSGSQSQKSSKEHYNQSSSAPVWDLFPGVGNKKHSGTKSSTHSENEVDSIHYELERSRSSTMTSQNENSEDCSHNSSSDKTKLSDHKQVVSKLSQIQTYLQQTADLMNVLVKSSDSQPNECGDSRRMQKFNKILTENYGQVTCPSEELSGNNIVETDEEELTRQSKESSKKIEALQKRKRDLLKLQEKAKQQLQEAQAEQSRLVARASNLHQELSLNKTMDLNVKQLNQRLKAIQQIYNMRNQVYESLNENQTTNLEEKESQEEHQIREVLSDTETDLQLVSDKMEELNVMKTQLLEIQKIMASINNAHCSEAKQHEAESCDSSKENVNYVQNGTTTDEEQPNEESSNNNNNVLKLEQVKSKLNHLTELLEIVQSAQNNSGLSPSYLQLVSNLVNEANSSIPSPAESVASQVKNSEEISIETMQMMTKELEQTTAAMKEERDKLEAARVELQNMARKLPLNKSRVDSLSADDDSEMEPPCLKLPSVDSGYRPLSRENIHSPNLSHNNASMMNKGTGKSKQNGNGNVVTSSGPDRQSKNDTLSRCSHPSSVGVSHNLTRDSRWSPLSSVTNSNDRTNFALQTQNQLETSGNFCDYTPTEAIKPDEISLQGMFQQHQMLTKTVAQCSQLLWLQQKQIIELRNALMLQNENYANFNFPPFQIPATGSVISNSPAPFYHGASHLNFNQFSTFPIQQHQNSHSLNLNNKSNYRESSIPNQELQEQYLNQGLMNYSDILEYDMRLGNANRMNVPHANQNQTSVINNRNSNGIGCLNPEDSGALNNQVPPGNRANNYWDNFRSYSRQNLLSNTKSNEGAEALRRPTAMSTQIRQQRDLLTSQNNQSGIGTSQHPSQSTGNTESTLRDQYLFSSSQNLGINHHSHISRTRSSDSQSHRTTVKNETRHQDNDSRHFNIGSRKNEGIGVGGGGGGGGARMRNPEPGCSDNLRSLRNDMNQNLRNADNLNSAHNLSQLSRDLGNEDASVGINNKKRLERTRGRKESAATHLNNRGYNNSNLWDNISSEVSNFIRTNEARPQFLIQLFRGLQQITTDNLRERTLESIQQTVSANNLSDRSSNSSGNLNLIENRNNIRENRSNLNRNQSDDPSRIEALFCQLRENQNTIRQNIGISSFVLGGNNLENPNISNIRDLVNLRSNNIVNEDLRDLRTYFEATLCNFGGNHSALENPNVSNIRENLTRGQGMSENENPIPKNSYLNICDNSTSDLRRNLEPSVTSGLEFTFRNIDLRNGGYEESEYPVISNDPVRLSNNQVESGSSFGEIRGNRDHFALENEARNSRFSIIEGGDNNFSNARQFLANANDSGIDINFNNEERKRNEESTGNDTNNKHKKNEDRNEAAGHSSMIVTQWDRNESGIRENNTFESSFNAIGESSFLPGFLPSDRTDLAEADQSRNDENSGAESDNDMLLASASEPDNDLGSTQNRQNFDNSSIARSGAQSENVATSKRNQGFEDCMQSFPMAEPINDFPISGRSRESSENNFFHIIPESERNFTEARNYESDENAAVDFIMKKNSSALSEETKIGRDEASNNHQTIHNQLYPSSESETSLTGTKYQTAAGAASAECVEVSGGSEAKESEIATGGYLSNSVLDYMGAAATSNGIIQQDYKLSNSKPLSHSNTLTQGEGSEEAYSDWEYSSGLDEVPTKLKKKKKKVAPK